MCHRAIIARKGELCCLERKLREETSSNHAYDLSSLEVWKPVYVSL